LYLVDLQLFQSSIVLLLLLPARNAQMQNSYQYSLACTLLVLQWHYFRDKMGSSQEKYISGFFLSFTSRHHLACGLRSTRPQVHWVLFCCFHNSCPNCRWMRQSGTIVIMTIHDLTWQ
jgi:hypothetical protein